MNYASLSLNMTLPADCTQAQAEAIEAEIAHFAKRHKLTGTFFFSTMTSVETQPKPNLTPTNQK
jgi:hypothetical protein